MLLPGDFGGVDPNEPDNDFNVMSLGLDRIAVINTGHFELAGRG